MGFRSLIGSTCSKSLSRESVMQITNCCAPLSRPSKQIDKLCCPGSKSTRTSIIRADTRNPAIPLFNKLVFFAPDMQTLDLMGGTVEDRCAGTSLICIEVFNKCGAVAVIPHCPAACELDRQAIRKANEVQSLGVTDRAGAADRC